MAHGSERFNEAVGAGYAKVERWERYKHRSKFHEGRTSLCSVFTPIRAKGSDASWSFGEFRPNDDFAAFAPLFGSWSLLIHDDEKSPLAREAADELRQVETALDGLRAHLHFKSSDQSVAITQLNIDGELIEWRADGKASTRAKA